MNKNILCIVVCVLAILLMTVLDSRGQIGITGNAAFVGAAGFAAASGATPTWDGQKLTNSITDSTRQISVYPLTGLSNTIAAGKFAVLFTAAQGRNTDPITGLTDSKGNTWTIVQQSVNSSIGARLAFAYSKLTSDLTSSDRITNAYTSSTYVPLEWFNLHQVTATSFEGSYSNSAYSTSIVASNAITHAPSLQLGIVAVRQNDYSLTSWTAAGDAWGYYNAHHIVKNSASGTGTIGPTAAFTIDVWTVYWGSFY